MKYASLLTFLVLLLSSNVYAGPLTDNLGFDSNNVVRDNNSELTFKLPDITAGTVYDIENRNLSPHIAIELFEYKKVVSDIGVANNTAFVSLGYNLIEIYDIHLFAFCGWNTNRERIAYGVGIGLLKF